MLSSFYSEISTITSATTVTEVTNPVITEESSSSSSGKPVDGTVDKVKKKKKAKVSIYLFVFLYVLIVLRLILGENSSRVSNEEKRRFLACRKMEESAK